MESPRIDAYPSPMPNWDVHPKSTASILIVLVAALLAPVSATAHEAAPSAFFVSLQPIPKTDGSNPTQIHDPLLTWDGIDANWDLNGINPNSYPTCWSESLYAMFRPLDETATPTADWIANTSVAACTIELPTHFNNVLGYTSQVWADARYLEWKLQGQKTNIIYARAKTLRWASRQLLRRTSVQPKSLNPGSTSPGMTILSMRAASNSSVLLAEHMVGRRLRRFRQTHQSIPTHRLRKAISTTID